MVSITRKIAPTAAVWVVCSAFFPFVHVAEATDGISALTNEAFVPDGDIGEFVNPSQAYFFTFPEASADFGKLLESTSVTPGVFIARDDEPLVGSTAAGPSGFRDPPASVTGTPVPTGFNLGRFFVSFNPDLDPDMNPANGTGVYFVALDISAPEALDTVSQTQPVAFDVDGDSSMAIQTELAPPFTICEAPLTANDEYRIILDTTLSGSGNATLIIGESGANFPDTPILPIGAIKIGPEVTLNCPGDQANLQRFVVASGLGFDFAKHFDWTGDGILTEADFGIGDDVEVAITNVTALPGNADPFCLGVTVTADSFDDVNFGGGAEDKIEADFRFPGPDLEVSKSVRCVDPAGGFAESVETYANGEVEFRVSIQNWGNTALTLTTDDLLTCVDPASVLPGSCTIEGAAPAGVNPNFCADLQAAFGVAAATSLSAQVDVGTLEPGDPCLAGAGEVFTFLFRVTVAPDGDNTAYCDDLIDCVNSASIMAKSEAFVENAGIEEVSGMDRIVTNGVVLIEDLADLIDTSREVTAGADDNTADVELVCRGLEFSKDVGPVGGPYVADYEIPSGPYPLSIEYRWTATNTGEGPEDITITDDSFCSAINGGLTDVSFGSCDICAGGGSIASNDVTAGDSFTTSCEVVFASSTGLAEFLAIDDGNGTCEDFRDARCLKNCASAESAAAGATCGNPALLTADAEATVCNISCRIEVSTSAQCLDNCVDQNPVGSEVTVSPFRTVQGACVQYRTEVENVKSSVDTPICTLLITDDFTNNNVLDVDPASVMITVGDNMCTVPAGFNVDGTPYQLDIPDDCNTVGLEFGRRVLIKYNTTITSAVGVTVHNVDVDGTFDCTPPPALFTCEDGDSLATQIVGASVTCDDKTWEFIEDANCDGVVNGADGGFSPPTSALDLTETAFPIKLRACFTARNTGPVVPLFITINNESFVDCVTDTPGVAFEGPCLLGEPSPAPIAPGDTYSICCTINVQSPAALNAMATCDGAVGGVYQCAATASATMVSDGTGVCVPNDRVLEGTAPCTAQILLPEPPEISIDKKVACEPDGPFAETVEALPGSDIYFQIKVTNEAAAPITGVCLTDTLDCDWLLVANSVTADVGGIDLSFNFADFRPDGTRRCFDFSGAIPPWLEQGDMLTLKFAVSVPDDFDTVGENPDCVNEVFAEPLTVCIDDPPNNTPPGGPATDIDTAGVNVVTPDLECQKLVSVDLGQNGTIDISSTGLAIILTEAQFPLDLIYTLRPRNTGETPLLDVKICDAELVNDASAVGMDTSGCNLDGSGCSAPVNLDVNAETSVECVIGVDSLQQLRDLMLLDGDAGDTSSFQYKNVATARGNIDTTGLGEVCGDPEVVESDGCMAIVQLEVPTQPGWNYADAEIRLTPSQPAYWSVTEGRSLDNSGLKFTILDPPFGRLDPDTGEQFLRGYIVAFAVNDEGDQIRWNHLFGEVTHVDYLEGTASSYHGYAFRALQGNNGQPVGTPGWIRFDGIEYASAFETLIFNFITPGSLAFSDAEKHPHGNSRPILGLFEPVATYSELTLMPLALDFRTGADTGGNVPGVPATRARFNIWNENENKKTNTRQCVNCWEQRFLSDFATPNWFDRLALGTDMGKAEVFGEAAGECNIGDIVSIDAAMAGVLTEYLDFENLMFSDQTAISLSGKGAFDGDPGAQIRFTPGGGGTTPESPAGTTTRDPIAGLGREFFDLAGPEGEEMVPDPSEIVTASGKGSVILFPNIHLRWDAAGNLTQDAFITLSNDYNLNPAVQVQLYFVNGDPPVPFPNP